MCRGAPFSFFCRNSFTNKFGLAETATHGPKSIRCIIHFGNASLLTPESGKHSNLKSADSNRL